MSTHQFPPQGYQCEISHFLVSVGAYNLILHIHVMVNIIESCQNRVSTDPVSHEDVAGSGIKPSWLRVFLKLFPD